MLPPVTFRPSFAGVINKPRPTHPQPNPRFAGASAPLPPEFSEMFVVTGEPLTLVNQLTELTRQQKLLWQDWSADCPPSDKSYRMDARLANGLLLRLWAYHQKLANGGTKDQLFFLDYLHSPLREIIIHNNPADPEAPKKLRLRPGQDGERRQTQTLNDLSYQRFKNAFKQLFNALEGKNIQKK
jgi:hypothetical protein